MDAWNEIGGVILEKSELSFLQNSVIQWKRGIENVSRGSCLFIIPMFWSIVWYAFVNKEWMKKVRERKERETDLFVQKHKPG